jgi:hypothetical protein
MSLAPKMPAMTLKTGAPTITAPVTQLAYQGGRAACRARSIDRHGLHRSGRLQLGIHERLELPLDVFVVAAHAAENIDRGGLCSL